VALRFALFVIVLVVIACIVATQGMEPAREFVQQATPQPGRLLPIHSMVENPLYLFVCLTFLSFVVAGLREEVWRSGMLVGLTRVLPARLPDRWKKALALVISSAIFGIGHITQGWGAVALAGAIGLGLGLVILYYESIWESVFAHGFFDATSFAAIYAILKFFPGFVPGL
jgi:membrane protease YdiL (CAAX protease family)